MTLTDGLPILGIEGRKIKTAMGDVTVNSASYRRLFFAPKVLINFPDFIQKEIPAHLELFADNAEFEVIVSKFKSGKKPRITPKMIDDHLNMAWKVVVEGKPPVIVGGNYYPMQDKEKNLYSFKNILRGQVVADVKIVEKVDYQGNKSIIMNYYVYRSSAVKPEAGLKFNANEPKGATIFSTVIPGTDRYIYFTKI